MIVYYVKMPAAAIFKTSNLDRLLKASAALPSALVAAEIVES